MNRLKQIDGLRGVAVIIVLLFHLLNNSYFNSIHINDLEVMIFKLTSIGWAGVNLFFVISGFLIGTILMINNNSNNYFKTFYIRRFLRIFPLYFLFLFCFVSAKEIVNNDDLQLFKDPIDLWRYFLMIQNFSMSNLGRFGSGGLIPTWSLAIEEQFYLIIPILIYFLHKNHLLILSIMMIFVSFLFRYNSSNWYMEYTHFFSRMDSLFLGVIVAIMNFNLQVKHYRSLKFWLFYFLILFFLILFWRFSKQLNQTLISYVFAGLLMLLLHSKQENSFISRLFANRLTFFFGKYSYFIYLFHQLINGVLFGLMGSKNPMLNSGFDYFIEIVALVLTISLARISHKYFESKFINFGRKFNYV